MCPKPLIKRSAISTGAVMSTDGDDSQLGVNNTPQPESIDSVLQLDE